MICNGDPRADGSVVLDIRRSGRPSTPLQGDTCADINLQCPVPWNHGFNEDNGSVQLPGNSCADVQLLEGTCADNPESRRIHAADGMVLGTSSADCHGQLQLCLGRAPGVSSAEGTCAGMAVVGPAVEGSGLPILVGSCADNWSV